jgi:cytochrome P450
MEFYALDVIGEISIGRDLGMLAAGVDHDYIVQGTRDANMIASKVGLAPKPIRDAIKILNRRFPALKLFGYGAAPTQAVIREIGKRQQGASFSDREDFMTKTLKLAKEGKLDPPEIMHPVGMNVGAGVDTTGISLTATIYYLMKNPASLTRLREELAEAERQAQISEPIKFSEAQKLPYFNAVLKEALRMHPAVGTILPRVVPEGGLTVAGHFLPPGVSLPSLRLS